MFLFTHLCKAWLESKVDPFRTASAEDYLPFFRDLHVVPRGLLHQDLPKKSRKLKESISQNIKYYEYLHLHQYVPVAQVAQSVQVHPSVVNNMTVLRIMDMLAIQTFY